MPIKILKSQSTEMLQDKVILLPYSRSHLFDKYQIGDKILVEKSSHGSILSHHRTHGYFFNFHGHPPNPTAYLGQSKWQTGSCLEILLALYPLLRDADQDVSLCLAGVAQW